MTSCDEGLAVIVASFRRLNAKGSKTQQPTHFTLNSLIVPQTTLSNSKRRQHQLC